MSEDLISYVNTVLVPAGLMAIMFSLGLTLALKDFQNLIAHPRAVAAGLTGHFLCLPLLGLAIAYLFRLPPEMAVGLFILSVCPAGVTSNAVTFAARGNVALAVILTTLTSVITVVTTPVLISWALSHFFDGTGNVPTISIPNTVRQLVMMTVVPIASGMVVRHFFPAWADRMVIWLRPTSVIILIAVIVFSLIVSVDLVMANLLHAGPAAWTLNVAAMGAGLLIARMFGLGRSDSMTVGIEVGIQNATMATFLSLSVLNSWALAITPTIYGCIMVINAGLMVRLIKRYWKSDDAQAA